MKTKSKIIPVCLFLIMFITEICNGQSNPADLTSFEDAIMKIIEKNNNFSIGETSIPKVRPGMIVDNELSSEAWEEAAVWQLRWEINRGENRLAIDKTYVLMVTDEESLHLLFVNYDSDPNKIRGTLTDRNAWIADNNDAVGLMLDTYNDGRNAYLMMVNAVGVQYDAMKFDRGGQEIEEDEHFNFLWSSSVFESKKGFFVRMSIPFRQLQIKSVGEFAEMGLLPFRLQPRELLYRYNSVKWDFKRNCYICQFPKVLIENSGSNSTEKRIQWIPYVSGIAEASGDDNQLFNHATNFMGSAGIDLKYQNTRSVLDATILPDFSQVEADAFQMTGNIQFLPSLPERRPFFMERSDLFRLPIEEIIYTRSIVDPSAGVRWTSKINRHNWAIVSVSDQKGWFINPGPQQSQIIVDESLSSWSNLLRYRFDLSSGIMIGGLYSDRITEDGFNRLASYDGQYAISSSHSLETQLLGSWNQYPKIFTEKYGVSSDVEFDYGYLVRFRKVGSESGGIGHDYRMETRRLGNELITGTGILQQTGIQQLLLVNGYNHWVDHYFIERIRPWLRNEGYWQLKDKSLISQLNQLGLHLFGRNRSYLRLQLDHRREIVERTTVNIMREGDFRLLSGRIRAETNITSNFFTSIDFSGGEAVDFTLVEKVNRYNLSLENEALLFNRKAVVSHIFDYMRLFQDQLAQDAITHRLRIDYQVSRNFAVRNIMQFRDFRFLHPRYPENMLSRIRTSQNRVLLRYRFNYATVFYLGGFIEFGEELPIEIQTDLEEHSKWQLFLKLSYLM